MTRTVPDEAGFSLLEVLVSVAILAVIGSISIALLSASLTAQEVNNDALDRTAMIDRTRTLLREDIGQIVLRPVRAEDGYAAPYVFAGDADGLAELERSREERVLLALTRRGRANPGLIQPRSSLLHVEYVLREGDLVRRATLYPDAAVPTPVSEQVLLTGIGSVEMGFLIGANWSARSVIPSESMNAAAAGTLSRALRLRYDLPGFDGLEHIVLTPAVRP